MDVGFFGYVLLAHRPGGDRGAVFRKRLRTQIRHGPNRPNDARPGTWRNGKFLTMLHSRCSAPSAQFGTSRWKSVPSKILRKRRARNAWGSVAHTYEIDFRNETADDCLWFYLHVKPETFARYVALIDQGAIDTVLFSVGSVEGFYSDWSPSISTNNVKVLLDGEEHKLDLPPDFQGRPPRLGRVHDARLLLHRALELGKAPPSPPAIDEKADPAPPANPALEITSQIDPRFLPVLASLKHAAWVAVALLAAIAAIALLKH